MRQRSTWATSKTAATTRTADIYEMNQEHPQPTPVEYENGSPDAWAETPVPGDKMSVNAEYDGDHVKRNSLNFAEFRDDTWKHKDSDKWHGPGKYDNAKVSSERKAMAAERLARAMLRTADQKLVEEQAIDMMALPAAVMVSTLKRLDAVSPDALRPENKYRRSLACCKLAGRLLPGAAEEAIEKLGSVMMGIDDPTLRSILQHVAAFRVAQQQEEQQEEEQGATSQQQQGQQEQQEEEQEEGKAAQEQQQAQQQQSQEQQQAQQQQGQQEEESAHCSQQEQQSQELTAEDLACLDEMLQGHAAPAGDAGLSALFAPAAPAATPAVPAVASASTSDISFDDDDSDGVPNVASDADLDALFNDNPEVVAQREIQAAELEAKARESGYATAAVARTASTKGAKKLGAVKAQKSSSADDLLGSLWERP